MSLAQTRSHPGIASTANCRASVFGAISSPCKIGRVDEALRAPAPQPVLLHQARDPLRADALALQEQLVLDARRAIAPTPALRPNREAQLLIAHRARAQGPLRGRIEPRGGHRAVRIRDRVDDCALGAA